MPGAAPSTMLRMVPLPRFAGEDHSTVGAPPFTGELSAKPTEGALQNLPQFPK